MNRAEVLAGIEDARTRSLVALLLRTPAELEAERKARQPAPPPQPPGARKGHKSGLQRTQGAGDRQPYHLDDKDELEQPMDWTLEPLDFELEPLPSSRL